MEKNKKTMAQDIPLCETKEILNKLKKLVDNSEPAASPVQKQIPKILIRSDGCHCNKKQEDSKLQHYCNLQTIRSFNKTPQQTFDLRQVIETENELSKSKELQDSPAKNEIQDSKLTCGSKEKKGKDELETESDDRKNIITVRRICQLNETKPPEMKALIKEGKLPPENEEVCTKDPKTGAFTCYTVQAGGRVIKQITEPQPLPEERKVEPHPILPIPKPSTNFELRGSKMLVGCSCLKRNGMQHDCLRSQCQGKRECLKFPAPVCQPSGLAPPIIKISPITTSIEPECGPRRKIQITKTEMEKRKVLLNYARAQYYQWPPSPRVPCKVHKKGLYYIRPLQKVADAQTDKEIFDDYIQTVCSANAQTDKDDPCDKVPKNEEAKKKVIVEETISKGDKDALKDQTEETKPKNKIEETIKKIEKDLNM